ncbi:MAG: pyridoxal 5'-phosphate synthase glutaminase subunit PdxT [Candidatus Helarchaeota archaeon]
MVNVGILALQGDTRFHEQILRKILKNSEEIRLIKSAKDLEYVDGVIIPGGESTVIGVLSRRVGLYDALKNKIINGLPTLGTCAGLVFLAKMVYDKTVGKVNQPILGILDVDVERNSYGTQKESFEADLKIPKIGEEPFKGIFIRAPVIKNIGPNVEVMAKYHDDIIAVKQDRIIGVTFHPELGEDLRFHKMFIDLIKAKRN